jgi:mitogen-activated protein kinase 1/3
VVTTAIDTLQPPPGKIAIKRIRPFANDDWDARHTLREIRLMKVLGPHPNIITLYDLSLNEAKAELYMMMELMDCDLHQIIQSKQPLTEMHHKCFTKQMLEGIKAMHDVGIFHRDLKVCVCVCVCDMYAAVFPPPPVAHGASSFSLRSQPANMLVSKDCRLRITDFGLARFVDEATAVGENRANPLTEYVVTRWYRCPELLLAPNRPYNEAIDLWAVGCIVAELLRRKPLFPGKSHAHQVQLIFDVVGSSPGQRLGFELGAEAAAFLEKRCRSRGQPIASLLPNASADAAHFVTSLLAVDPLVRPTAAQALAAEFLKDAETLCDYDRRYLSRPPRELFDFEQEKHTLEDLKRMIIGEVKLSERAAAAAQRGSSSSSSSSSGRGSSRGDSGSSRSSNKWDVGAQQASANIVGGGGGSSHSSSSSSSTVADAVHSSKSSGTLSSATTPRTTYPPRQYMPATAPPATAAIVVTAGHVLAASTGLRAPKTPSPKKMDIILAKSQRAKLASLEGGGGSERSSSADLVERVKPQQQQVQGQVQGQARRLTMSDAAGAAAASMRAAMTRTGQGSVAAAAAGAPSTNQRGGLLPPPTTGFSGLLSQFSHRYSGNAVGPGPAAGGSSRPSSQVVVAARARPGVSGGSNKGPP